MIEIEVIADSLHPTGQSRLTTFKVRMPLARWREVLTHRTHSRNASSARAIPAKRLRASTKVDNCRPKWTRNRPGMSGRDPLPPVRAFLANQVWAVMAFCLRAVHWCLEKLDVHKEHVNYVLDPIAHINAILTATDEGWSNFCTLRNHEAAHPDLQRLGALIENALRTNKPTRLSVGEWHLPYADAEGPLKQRITQSAARCCRVTLESLETPGKRSTAVEDAATVTRLIGSDPKHTSPTEHQACAVPLTANGQGNFGPASGWQQYRKSIPNEANLNRFKATLEVTHEHV